MRAVGLRRYLPVDDPDALLDLELPTPSARGRDLLVEVEAVSVNPIDVKQRAPEGRADLYEDPPRVLGFDAAGVVVQSGEQCHLFRPGDAVYYAGTLGRGGSNAQFQLVDERVVGPQPRTLTPAETAALALTSLTAWEALFDRMGLEPDGANRDDKLLVVGGAGGVGSMAVQLGRRAGLRVIATASRPESAQWARSMGAHLTFDYRDGLEAGLEDLGVHGVDWILCTQRTDLYWEQMAQVISPQGAICCIVDSATPLDLNLFKAKSISVAWESMFTRSVFQTDDLVRQHEILARVARLVEQGSLRSTHAQTLGPINAENLRLAHRSLESGTTIGKLVLAGWQ